MEQLSRQYTIKARSSAALSILQTTPSRCSWSCCGRSSFSRRSCRARTCSSRAEACRPVRGRAARRPAFDDSPLLPIHLSFSTGVESLHWSGAGAAAAQPSVRDDDGSGSVGSLEGEDEAASSSCEPLKLSRIWPVLTRLMVMSLWSVGVLVASRFARQRTGTVL